MGPNDKFDLVHQGRRSARSEPEPAGKRDIGIRYGLIEALEADIPRRTRAERVLNAAGKLVTPGLIDLHAHVYPYGSAIGIPADELIALPGHDHHGVGGRRRRQQLRRLPPLQRGADAHAAVTPSCTSPISGWPAFPVPELYNIDFAQVEAAAKAVAENADIVLGVKVRM